MPFAFLGQYRLGEALEWRQMATWRNIESLGTQYLLWALGWQRKDHFLTSPKKFDPVKQFLKNMEENCFKCIMSFLPKVGFEISVASFNGPQIRKLMFDFVMHLTGCCTCSNICNEFVDRNVWTFFTQLSLLYELWELKIKRK